MITSGHNVRTRPPPLRLFSVLSLASTVCSSVGVGLKSCGHLIKRSEHDVLRSTLPSLMELGTASLLVKGSNGGGSHARPVIMIKVSEHDLLLPPSFCKRRQKQQRALPRPVIMIKVSEHDLVLPPSSCLSIFRGGSSSSGLHSP